MLISEFGRQAPNRLFAAVVLGCLAGVCYAFLIPIVLSSLRGAGEGETVADSQPFTLFSIEIADHRLAAVFLALCLFILVARTASRVMLTRISVEMTVSLRSRLYARILSADLHNLERVGAPRLMATMTEDVKRIILGGQLLPDLLMNCVTLLGILGFLAFLNGPAFVFVLQAILFGVVTHQVPVFLSTRSFRKSRQIFGKLQESITGLVYGAKELKLNSASRRTYLNEVVMGHERDLLQSDKATYTTLVAANAYGDLLSFFVIGVVAFVFINYHAVSTTELVGIVMALLYVSGPVAVIMDVIAPIAMAKSAVASMERVFAELSEDPSQNALEAVQPWRHITFEDLVYEHPRSSRKDGFSVGPVGFEIRRGQLTFIVGGNGSGKSTLCKMISLHYLPMKGRIHFGEHPVTDRSRESFRQEVSAIYSDYHLFERLLCPLDDRVLAQARMHLVDLGLEDKVSIEDGQFSTLALSDGQRKRLALMVALMEDRSLYVFDEWAADQDPAFKEVFYRKILPSLRARDKAVVIISHDDRYFDIADQILVMESGKLVDSRTPVKVPYREG